MANRHLSRTLALQSLFQWDFYSKHEDDLLKVLEYNFSEFAPEFDDKDFASNLLKNVTKNAPKIDKLIIKFAPEWPLEQITLVDRNVLRIGIFELKFSDTIPPKVAINEAIELAKTFGGDASGKFINGVLGSIYKQMETDGEKQDMDKPTGEAQISSGGIIYYEEGDKKFYALVLDAHNKWTFPKGKVGPGEDLRDTAIREVEEEIGLKDITLYDKIGEIEVVVNEPNKKPVPKTIHLFLGEVKKQDLKVTDAPELKDACWVDETEVVAKLGYEQAKKMFEQVLKKQ
ncbi:MAG: transcription antitermination factor NusB [Proteobacteria bacterium]|nr:transcription antitermination factor NusB [Pseudomonadota bacterium]